MDIENLGIDLFWKDLLLESGPSYIIPLNFNFGFIFSRMLTSKKSINVLELVLEKFPLNVFAWNLLGSKYEEVQEYDKSIRAFKRALDIRSDSSESWSLIGITYNKMNRFEKAFYL